MSTPGGNATLLDTGIRTVLVLLLFVEVVQLTGQGIITSKPIAQGAQATQALLTLSLVNSSRRGLLYVAKQEGENTKGSKRTRGERHSVCSAYSAMQLLVSNKCTYQWY